MLRDTLRASLLERPGSSQEPRFRRRAQTAHVGRRAPRLELDETLPAVGATTTAARSPARAGGFGRAHSWRSARPRSEAPPKDARLDALLARARPPASPERRARPREGRKHVSSLSRSPQRRERGRRRPRRRSGRRGRTRPTSRTTGPAAPAMRTRCTGGAVATRRGLSTCRPGASSPSRPTPAAAPSPSRAGASSRGA